MMNEDGTYVTIIKKSDPVTLDDIKRAIKSLEGATPHITSVFANLKDYKKIGGYFVPARNSFGLLYGTPVYIQKRIKKVHLHFSDGTIKKIKI